MICPACALDYTDRGGQLLCPNGNCPRHTIQAPDFDQIFELAHPFSLLSWAQGYTLYQELRRAPPGPVAEFGVYKGGSALMLHLADPARTLHLFDTFSGHPDLHTAHDRPGSHAPGTLGDTSVTAVVQRLTGAGARVVSHVGIFPDDVELVALPRFAFVHVDVDLWASARAALQVFEVQLWPGGVLVMDDFGTDECPGVKEVVVEFLAVHQDWHFQLTAYPTYQAVLWKPVVTEYDALAF